MSMNIFRLMMKYSDRMLQNSWDICTQLICASLREQRISDRRNAGECSRGFAVSDFLIIGNMQKGGNQTRQGNPCARMRSRFRLPNLCIAYGRRLSLHHCLRVELPQKIVYILLPNRFEYHARRKIEPLG